MYLKVTHGDGSEIYPVEGMIFVTMPSWHLETLGGMPNRFPSFNRGKLICVSTSSFFNGSGVRANQGWGRSFRWQIESGDEMCLLTNETVYLMNDSGNTIETYRSVLPPRKDCDE